MIDFVITEKLNRPGPPRKYHTPEEKRLAENAKHREYNRRTRHVAIERDLAEVVDREAMKLEAQFGFRPTFSQTLKHMLKKLA